MIQHFANAIKKKLSLESFLTLYQTHFLSGNDGLRTVGYADRAQQSVDMQFDGSFGNAHLIGNLFIGQSLRDQIQNLSLPVSQGFAFGLGAVAVGLRCAAPPLSIRAGGI